MKASDRSQPTTTFYLSVDGPSLFFFFKHLEIIYVFLFFAVLGLFCSCGKQELLSIWLRCAGFLLQWLLLLRSTDSRLLGSVAVAHGLSSLQYVGSFQTRD